MEKASGLLEKLDTFIDRLATVNKGFLRGINSPDETEKILGEYTAFILDDENRKIWEECIDPDSMEIRDRIANVQRESSHCVWAMEKYRAMALITADDGTAEYFKNIEGCIEDEFGSFQADKNSRILLIGAGAFPMTPLLIARNTGAKVLGIDIDEVAVEYAKKVLGILGADLDIEITTRGYDDLEFTGEATHIIFASTIPDKFDILRDLYTLTSEDVVVMMRYGNGFKSLFNYPLADMHEGLWEKVESVCREGNVFDVALYKKHLEKAHMLHQSSHRTIR